MFSKTLLTGRRRRFDGVDILNELAATRALFTARLLAGEMILSTAVAERMAEAGPEKGTARARTHLFRAFEQVGSVDTTAVNFFLGTCITHRTNQAAVSSDRQVAARQMHNIHGAHGAHSCVLG